MAKHIFALIHIRTKGEVGTVKHVKPSSFFYWRSSFVDPFCYLFLIYVFVTLSV